MLPTVIRRAAESARPLFDFENNPYKARSTWPPNFDQLSPKQQFRYERTYRRRAQLKWARPAWTKGTIIAQWAMIGTVLIYGVLYMDTTSGSEEVQPFQAARDWWRHTADSIWTAGSSKEARESLVQAQENARARDAQQRS